MTKSKNIFIAIDPAGVEHKRNASGSGRQYTHTVVAQRSIDADIAYAEGRSWEKTERSNYAYYLKIAEGNDPYPRQTYRSAERGDTPEQIAEERAAVDAENAKSIADAQARLGGINSAEEYIAAQRIDMLLKIAKNRDEGVYERWNNMGWCGRLDLAQKLAAKNAYGIQIYRNATVLAAIKKEA